MRPQREELLQVARRREVDLVVVWRLDRWGRSLVDLVTTLQELMALGVGFVSLSEALDMTTPSGRALAGMLAVFADYANDPTFRKIGRLRANSLTIEGLVGRRSHKLLKSVLVSLLRFLSTLLCPFLRLQLLEPLIVRLAADVDTVTDVRISEPIRRRPVVRYVAHSQWSNIGELL